MRYLFFLLLAFQLSLSAQEKKAEFSFLYLPSFPMSEENKSMLNGPQWLGGGFIFGGGKWIKGIASYNFISSAGLKLTRISEGTYVKNPNYKIIDLGIQSHLVSLGFVIDFPEKFFVVAAPSIAIGSRAMVITDNGNYYTYRFDYDTDERLSFIGFKAGAGVNFKTIQLLALYEHQFTALSAGIAFKF